MYMYTYIYLYILPICYVYIYIINTYLMQLHLGVPDRKNDKIMSKRSKYGKIIASLPLLGQSEPYIAIPFRYASKCGPTTWQNWILWSIKL